MILFSSISHDPDEPEGSKSSGSKYVGRKDMIIIACILGVLGLLFKPVYDNLKKNSEYTLCVRNLTAIKSAINEYASQFDDRIPPLYVEGDNRSPLLVKGVPNVWASVIAPYMSKSYGGFTCPTAQKGEHTIVQNNPLYGDKDLQLTYGLYAGLAARPISELTDPSNAIAIAETNNHGSGKTYNPMPLITSKDEVVPVDGMMIGWDNSNFKFDEKTESVTRLAFRNTEEGRFNNADVEGRHKNSINVLMVNGTLHKISPNDAYVQRSGNRLTGFWQAR